MRKARHQTQLQLQIRSQISNSKLHQTENAQFHSQRKMVVARVRNRQNRCTHHHQENSRHASIHHHRQITIINLEISEVSLEDDAMTVAILIIKTGNIRYDSHCKEILSLIINNFFLL